MIIAVSSGKDGAGKTNVSLNLSIALSQLGKKVWLLDADMGPANVGVLLGAQPEMTLYHVLFEGKTLDEVAINGPSGVKIIPGGSGIQELARIDKLGLSDLSSAFSGLASESDFLIVDTSSEISPENLAFSRAADAVVVIFTPKQASLTDGFSVIQVLCVNRYAGDIYILPNMVDSAKSAHSITEKIKAAAVKSLSRKLDHLPSLPRDKAVTDAGAQQMPFMEADPSSAASLRMGEIAVEVVSISESRGDNRMAPADYILDVVGYANDVKLSNLVKRVNEKRAQREAEKLKESERPAQAKGLEGGGREYSEPIQEAVPSAAVGVSVVDTRVVAGLLQHMEGLMKTMVAVFDRNTVLYEKTLEILSSISENMSNSRNVAPPMREPALQMREPAPQVREPLPPVREPAPQVREPLPPVREPLPPVREPAPPMREPAPPMREPAPPMREPAPQMREPAPPVREPAPQMREPAPPVREPAPQMREPAPQMREPAPQMRELSPLPLALTEIEKDLKLIEKEFTESRPLPSALTEIEKELKLIEKEFTESRPLPSALTEIEKELKRIEREFAEISR